MKSKTLPTLLIALLSGSLFVPVAGAATYVTWTANRMSRTGDTVATNGTLVYAYCQANEGRAVTNEVNEVPFTGLSDVTSTGDFTFGGYETWHRIASYPIGVSGAYSNLLAHCWWAVEGDHELRLTKLTPGSTYLVQLILGFWDTSNPTVNTWASVSDSDRAYTGWNYGGTLIGTFTAQSETEAFVVTYDTGNAILNALQVREIATGGQAPVDPSIGSVTAATARRRATITLADVAMGTDIDCNPAQSYTVSYRLTKGADLVAEKDVPGSQTGATASFAIQNLDEGDYVCEVAIETDKGKTATASVSFSILPEGDFAALKAAIEGAGPGATIQVAKGYYTATSQINATAANLTVVSPGGREVAILDGGSTNRLLYVSGANFKVVGITFKNGHFAGNGGAIVRRGDLRRTEQLFVLRAARELRRRERMHLPSLRDRLDRHRRPAGRRRRDLRRAVGREQRLRRLLLHDPKNAGVPSGDRRPELHDHLELHLPQPRQHHARPGRIQGAAGAAGLRPPGGLPDRQ